jgi:hypothetical protein
MYYDKKPIDGMFVKAKNHKVLRARIAYRSLVATLTSFVSGYLVFAALSGSTDIVLYSIAFMITWIMRTALHFLLPALSEHIDIENPAIILLVSLGVSLATLLLIIVVKLVL